MTDEPPKLTKITKRKGKVNTYYFATYSNGKTKMYKRGQYIPPKLMHDER